MGQHAGMTLVLKPTGVGQYPGICFVKVALIAMTDREKVPLLKGVGQHARMVGQHVPEWWVNILRNLQKWK